MLKFFRVKSVDRANLIYMFIKGLIM
jgi:hypothetical protein